KFAAVHDHACELQPDQPAGGIVVKTAQTSRSGGGSAEEDRRVVEKAGTDGLELGDRLAEWDEHDDITLEGDHGAEGLLVHGADGPQLGTGGPHEVVSWRRSAL